VSRSKSRAWYRFRIARSHKAASITPLPWLLPDASVLVGGGGAPGPEANANAEIYYPLYLFRTSGGFAVRPKIKTAPTRLSFGQRFTLTVDRPAAIKAVTLIKAGSVTHSLNMEQRFQKLPFTVVDGKLSIQAPARAAPTCCSYLTASACRQSRESFHSDAFVREAAW
jgi:hypothetical protein